MAWNDAFPLAAGGLMLALAAWLVVLNPRSRLHRAFAIFLVVRGAANIFSALIDTTDTDPTKWQWVAMTAAEMVLPCAGAYLILAVLGYARGRRFSPVFGWALLAIAISAEAAFLLRPRWVIPLGPGAILGWWPVLRFVVYALAAFLFAHAYAGRVGQPTARAVYLASLGLILNAAYYTAFPFYFMLQPGALAQLVPATWAVGATFIAASLLVAATVVRLIWAAARVPAARGEVGIYLGLVVVAAMSNVLGNVFLSGAKLSAFDVAVDGAWTLAMPALLAHAILRHRLLGMDEGVQVALRRGTAATLLLGTFFVVTQLAQNFLQLQGDWIVGSVAAGLMLFAASPLQRAAERLAASTDKGKSGAAKMGLPPESRHDIFRDHLRVVWADGQLTAKERVLLRRLRERLGLTPEEAERLEAEVVRL